MPSYKPKVQILLTTEYHEKFKALCEKERRSDSVMGAIMIEKYINDYEAEHGEIPIRETTRKEAWNEQMANMQDKKTGKKGTLETLKDSWRNGIDFGNAKR